MKKFLSIGICMVLICTLLCSCSAGSKDSAGYSADTYYNGFENEGTAQNTTATDEGGTGTADFSEYKIIKTAELEIHTKEFDKALEYVNERLSQYGGYVSSSMVRGEEPQAYGDSGRYAQLEIRVSSDKLDEFLDGTSENFEVTYKNIYTDDVTSSYFDTQSRLKIYRTQYDRIIAIMEKAENVEDLISLESELTRITYEIESLTTEIKRWDELIDYSVVTLSLYETNTFSGSSSKSSFGERISDGFMSSLYKIGAFFEGLAAGIIIYSPWILMFGAIAVIIIIIVKKHSKSKKASRSAVLKTETENEANTESPEK